MVADPASDALRTESPVSQINTRQRQPVVGQTGTSDPPASGPDPSRRTPEQDDLVWPPEPEAMNAIEVVPLERLSNAGVPVAAPPPGAVDPPAAVPTGEPAREPSPETHRFDDLQDLDLDTLFAPPAGAARPAPTATANRDAATPLTRVAARPAMSTPNRGPRPGASRPDRETAHKPTATTPDHPPVGRDLPDYVPSAVLAQPEEVGSDLLLIPPAQEQQAGTPPTIHIKWDERLDDDVPAVPLSGLPRGRELAKARRAAASAARAGNASPAAARVPAARAVHVARVEPGIRDLPGAATVSPNRASAVRPARSTGRRAVMAAATAGVLLVIGAGGWVSRASWWDPVRSAVTELSRNTLSPSDPPHDEASSPAAPTAPGTVSTTNATGTTTGGEATGAKPPASEPAPEATDTSAAATSARELLPATNEPETSIPVPPPVRVEVPTARRAEPPASTDGRSDVTYRPVAPSGPAEVTSRDVPPARLPLNLPGDQRAEVPRDLPAETTARTALPAPPVETASSPSAAPASAPPAADSPTPAEPARNEIGTARNAEADVRSALASYRSAYANLDAIAARRIWPTVDERALARAFSSLKSQQIRFDRCDVQVGNGAATARCEGAATFVPRVGRQEPQTEQRRWSFVLRQSSDGWQIERAETSR